MNPKSTISKQKGVQLHLFFCLMQLLLENLDELKIDHPRGIELHKTLTDFCELLNDNASGTYAVQKSTYFSELSNKINTLVRRNFKKLCEELKLPYHSLKGLKFPIKYKDLIIYKKVLE